MGRRSTFEFTSVRSEGAILPPDLLARVAAEDTSLDGLSPADYHLDKGEQIREAVSRAWNRLHGSWASFKAQRSQLRNDDPGTSPTRERWLLPLFDELGYGRLLPKRVAAEVGGRHFPISHEYGHVPIHLVGCNVKLDERTRGVVGAARVSPHGLVQSYLNASDASLWAFLSNGKTLRILRDSAALTRQAYVEFDLEAMMEGEQYADFVLLWLLCHQSRVEAAIPEEMWLERWSRTAADQGTRALDHLREGVEGAIKTLGAGFLAYPGNKRLRESLRSGALSTDDFYRAVLRLIYRLIFLFVAEDRGLLLDPKADEAAKQRYRRFYSTTRLRDLATKLRGTRHADLYRGLRVVMGALGRDEGAAALALPPLGSFLWSEAALQSLDTVDLSNGALLEAVRSLTLTSQQGQQRGVDFRNIGPEEVGSVYESLLELHPEIHAEAATFELRVAAGHERKTTGSYYTPDSLVQCLLDSALDPVLDEAARKPDPVEAILALKVCEPACGSGHFIIAAAHRIARRLASARTGDDEPSPEATRRALRDVIGHCLYGVDVNPMAVELCKVNLWLEALEPGKPLSFLDNRILCGNSLLGTTAALLAEGIPDDAFDPIEGDDKIIARDLKKRNKREREGGARTFGFMSEPAMAVADAESVPIADAARRLDTISDDTIGAIHEKERRHSELAKSAEYWKRRLAADAWCSAFVWRKTRDAPPAISEDLFRSLRSDPDSVGREMRSEIERLARQYQFFHWHLAFPTVFGAVPDRERAGTAPRTEGFDVLLANPPWDRLALQEKEFFSQRDSKIASAPNAAARGRLIKALESENPGLLRVFEEASRKAAGTSHLVRNSGQYPLCGRGDVNSYAIFAELSRTLIAPAGRVGCIVPSGIATDDTTKFFFQDLVEHGSLVSLYDFQSGTGLFSEVGHARFKFCLLTLLGGGVQRTALAEFAFSLRNTGELDEPERRFQLTPEEIALLNPNTRTCPIFRTRRDAELIKAIYRRVPVLVDETKGKNGNPWGVAFLRLFDMANDSELFLTRGQLASAGWTLNGNLFTLGPDRCLPLYEAKMVWQYDHRFGTFESAAARPEGSQLPSPTTAQYSKPGYSPLPWYWVPNAALNKRLEHTSGPGLEANRPKWLLVYRFSTAPTNERTMVMCVIPGFAANHILPCIVPKGKPDQAACIAANANSLIFDYLLRNKMGRQGLDQFFLKQIPFLAPTQHSPRDVGFITPRVLELTYTAWDLDLFAHDLGYDGPPFRWNTDRRFLLRCELDAVFFHLYGISHDDVDYILETFPIVRKNDEKKHGEYRTKRVILEIYGAMAESIRTGSLYQTPLDPPPADPRTAHEPWQEQP
jgi:N-6 DNA Methylase